MPVTQQKLYELKGVYQGEGHETVRLALVVRTAIDVPPFQRDRKAKKIATMAAEFDKTAYVFPLVALFKGRMILLDGQQRHAVTEMHGTDKITVLLIEGIKTEARLAALYLLKNRDTTLLTSFEKFIGALAAKDRGTLDIERIVKAQGLRVDKAASANGHVPSGVIVWIHELGGNDLLERTLETVTLAWGGCACKETYEADTLRGVFTFIRRYGDKVDQDRLVRRLQTQHPAAILQHVQAGRGRKAKVITYSDYLRKTYNSGLPRREQV
jgi:hypothetical protein